MVNNVCKIDKDNHVINNTFELSVADRYVDRGGCAPDAFQLRKIGSPTCGFTVSIDDCVRPGALEGDFRPRPRLSDFVGSVSAPATVPVNPGPLALGRPMSVGARPSTAHKSGFPMAARKDYLPRDAAGVCRRTRYRRRRQSYFYALFR